MKRLLAVRCVLGLLIILNLLLITGFSGENAEESDSTSHKVTQNVAQIVVSDFENKTEPEQIAIVDQMHPTVRNLAHMAEFGSLALLIMLFVCTWKLHRLVCAGISLGATVLYASIDELHQHLANSGRAGQVQDVLLDALGGLIGCAFVLLCILIAHVIQKRKEKKPLKITRYQIPSQKLTQPLRIALAADLHDNPYGRVLDALRQEKPDLILIPGDLTDDETIRAGGERALAFLKGCAEIAPTYYSLGNHEIACYHRGNPFRHPIPIPVPQEFRDAVAQTGAVLLDNEWIARDGITFFGLTSGIHGKENRPNADTLEAFRKTAGELKILLCHHPEYLIPYLGDLEMDLTVCGHAHGGHWRIFGRGVYAPGQGLFPKYTSGIVNGNRVISRGLGNHTKIPRIFNPTELVIITLGNP